MRAKKPTRNEKEIIKAHNLNWNDWLVLPSDLEDNIKLQNKITNQVKIISKYVRKK